MNKKNELKKRINLDICISRKQYESAQQNDDEGNNKEKNKNEIKIRAPGLSK